MSSAQSSLSGPIGGEAEHTVVALRGEHDAPTVAALWTTLAQAIELNDADLVIDLSEVEYLGAGAVDAIIRAGERLHLRSRSLELRSPSPCAQRVLDVCELTALMEVQPFSSASAL